MPISNFCFLKRKSESTSATLWFIKFFIVFISKLCIKEIMFLGLELGIVPFHVGKLQLPSKSANTTAQRSH